MSFINVLSFCSICLYLLLMPEREREKERVRVCVWVCVCVCVIERNSVVEGHYIVASFPDPRLFSYAKATTGDSLCVRVPFIHLRTWSQVSVVPGGPAPLGGLVLL